MLSGHGQPGLTDEDGGRGHTTTTPYTCSPAVDGSVLIVAVPRS